MHETVAAWAANYFKNHPLKELTMDTVTDRMQEREKHINKSHNVASLTKGLPKRVAAILPAEGDRITN